MDVRTGVVLLFLLEHDEARAAFERAEAHDPECAIAGWGRALAWLALPNGVVSDAAQERARVALARAAGARHASARERAYIETASRLLEPRSSSYASRLHAFALGARALGSRYPSDDHPTLLVALAHLSMSSAPGDMGQREAATAIVLRLGESPADPAAAALLIRARDNPADAETARSAAEGVLRARPPSPRALQAAARLFHRLGAWDEAVRAGEVALAVAGGAEAASLLQEGRWQEHPLPWLIQADVSAGCFSRARGRLVNALARSEAVSAAAEPRHVWRLRALIDVGWSRLRRSETDWSGPAEWRDGGAADLVSLVSDPPDGSRATDSDRALSAEAVGSRVWVGGLIAARAAWPRGEDDRLAAARAAVARLDALAANHPVPPRFELLRTEVQAATSAALEARDELALLEAHLAGLRQRLQATVSDMADVGGSEALCGDLHMQLRDWYEASRGYAAVVAASPRCARAQLGLARASRRLGQLDRASRAAAAFLSIWEKADPDRPELAEARSIVARQ